MVSTRLLRMIKYPPRAVYALGLGRFYGRLVLLITTTGRKTGLPRVTPLQYEETGGEICVASMRGERADWFRNIRADPRVEVRIGSRRFRGVAEPITETGRVTDFIELRLSRHPRMIGAILRWHGVPWPPSRADLEDYAAGRSMAIIRAKDS